MGAAKLIHVSKTRYVSWSKSFMDVPAPHKPRCCCCLVWPDLSPMLNKVNNMAQAAPVLLNGLIALSEQWPEHSKLSPPVPRLCQAPELPGKQAIAKMQQKFRHHHQLLVISGGAVGFSSVEFQL